MAQEGNIVRTISYIGEVAGHIGCWEQAGERLVGYWLGRSYWGKGIASTALAQFLELVKARPLHARVVKHNAASIRVLQKCGFTISGEDRFPWGDGEAEEYIFARGMEAFPFTQAEWKAVSAALLPVVNAWHDSVLQASHMVLLCDVLRELRERYGDHPVLLETEADFVENEEESRALYERALRIAVTNGLPTLSIGLSLAQLLLNLGERASAREVLRACEGEMRMSDDDDRAEWARIFAESR